MGGVLTQTINQFSLISEDTDLLEKINERLEQENLLLQNKVDNLQSQLEKKNSPQGSFIPNVGQPILSGSDDFTIASGSTSHIQEEKNVVIQSGAEFLELWSEMGTGEPLPFVDFSRNIVLGAFYGEKPNGCYTVKIDTVIKVQVTESWQTGVVKISKTVPSEPSQCPQRTTNSYHLIQIPDFPGSDISFNEKIVTLE